MGRNGVKQEELKMISKDTIIECARWLALDVKPFGQRSKKELTSRTIDMQRYIKDLVAEGDLKTIQAVFDAFYAGPSNVELNKMLFQVGYLLDADFLLFFNQNQGLITYFMSHASSADWRSSHVVETFIIKLSGFYSKLTYDFETLLSSYYPDLVDFWYRKKEHAVFEEENPELIASIKKYTSEHPVETTVVKDGFSTIVKGKLL